MNPLLLGCPGWVFKLSFLSSWVWGGCRAVLGDKRDPGAFTPSCPSCPLSKLFGSRSLVGELGSGLMDDRHGQQLS